jgi:hypothetical protein
MKTIISSPDRIAMEGLSFDAVGEAAELAATYADLAVRFAAVNDARGVNYALRTATAALLTATQAAEMISRPAGRRGGA